MLCVCQILVSPRKIHCSRQASSFKLFLSQLPQNQMILQDLPGYPLPLPLIIHFHRIGLEAKWFPATLTGEHAWPGNSELSVSVGKTRSLWYYFSPRDYIFKLCIRYCLDFQILWNTKVPETDTVFLRNFGARKTESDMGGVELDTSSRDPPKIGHSVLQSPYLSSDFALIL